MTGARVPLSQRPLDLIYFIFFLVHIPATLSLDLQAIYPDFIAKHLQFFGDFYVNLSNDPLIGGVSGHFGASQHLAWFKSFLWLEALFQLPVFFLGARGLYKGVQSIYVLILVYAASTATTTLACLAMIFITPPKQQGIDYIGALSTGQRALLLGSYIPFFLIPLVMAVDMSFRVSGLVRIGLKALNSAKSK
ncbi:hypothetical protein AX16_001703 [Volvariella volvacea WC 439]|nr:hypothetical protein AX16_001703 [Volvariella volvacea WC 439]